MVKKHFINQTYTPRQKNQTLRAHYTFNSPKIHPDNSKIPKSSTHYKQCTKKLGKFYTQNIKHIKHLVLLKYIHEIVQYSKV